MTQTSKQRILVTGSSGFIGTAFCQNFDFEHYRLRALRRSLENIEGVPGQAQVEFVSGDVCEADSLLEAARDVDVIVHLAGIAHVNRGTDAEYRRTIVEGTRNLLEAALKQNVKRIVYLSSSLAQAVDDSLGEVTEYGKHKKAAEDLLLQASATGSIEVVILRPVNVYGPGMKGNIAAMISLIQSNRLPPLPALATRLSLVGVADVVQALKLAIEHEQASGKVYLLTDGQDYRIDALEQAIYANLGKQFPGWRTPRMVLFAAACLAELLRITRIRRTAIGLRTYRNITTDNVFDNSAICRELGFKPGTTFYQELPRIIAKISQTNN